MAPAPHVIETPPSKGRWSTYLRERFPLEAHGPLVLAFAGGVVCWSAAVHGAPAPGLKTLALTFVIVLGFFFQLRVADEWKDLESDQRYRPERPVPRGIVTLRELIVIAALVAIVQALAAFAIGPALLFQLAAVWAFGSLMSVEFFARQWLQSRPFATLVSHGLVVPVIAYFAVSAEVISRGSVAGENIWSLLLASFFAGNVIEIGRKLWAPDDERDGVETYSGAWGVRRASLLFAMVSLLSAVFAAAAWCAIPGLGEHPTFMWLTSTVLVSPVLLIALRYALRPSSANASRVAAASAVWTLTL